MADEERLRLQVYLARCGVASRRKAEGVIAAGRVTVNGSVVTVMGTKVSPTDEVRLDGQPLEPERHHRYLALHKPPGVITAVSDPQGRRVVTDLVKDAVDERVYPAGRLDYWSTGLVLLTNDGDFTRVIVHPSFEIEKEYTVETREPLSDDVLRSFVSGVHVDGVSYRARDCRRLDARRAGIVLTEGKNREIRRVLEKAGLTVRKLHRTRVGIVRLGSLGSGRYRPLTRQEVWWFLEKGRGSNSGRSN
ncbi:MAG: pseudouridine synthase [Spirochaetaceae bacterium]